MKKVVILLFIFSLLIAIFPFFEVKASSDLLTNAKAGVLMEESSGTVIYEKNMNEKMSIASLTKMMGMILIMESLEDGTIKLDEKVKVSQNASGMGGSQIWLSTGEEMMVSDLIKGIMMASANDGIVCMAERLAGTEEKFVEKMNEKAKELGLKNTNFVNASGLDEENHYSTAYDLAIVAKELISHEKILEFTSIYEDYLRKDTTNPFWLVNTNKLVKTYQGADGLKTGMTDNAGYCMAVTAKRNNMRLIAIVLGEENGKVRNLETTELLDYGFNLYSVTTIKKKGEVLGEVKLDKASLDKINIVAGSDVIVLKKQGEQDKEYKSEIKLNTIELPIKKGDKLGTLIVKDDYGNKIDEVVITSLEDVSKDNFLNIFWKVIKGMIQGELL